MIVFLVGFMGSGKTYWATKLSEALQVPWVDLDQIIADKESASIPVIFEEKGESYFRESEAACLRSLIYLDDGLDTLSSVKITAVVATGGGAPCFHNNMDWMISHGLAVWLNPPVSELVERLKMEMADRPLLQHLSAEGLEGFISGKLKEREEFYSKAKLDVKNTNIAVAEFVNLILHA